LCFNVHSQHKERTAGVLFEQQQYDLTTNQLLHTYKLTHTSQAITPIQHHTHIHIHTP